MKIEDYLNKEDLSNRLDGDMELFRDLAELFFEDSQHLIDNIEKSIKEKDPELLRKSAHTLKGSVSNFSAKRAFDAAYSLENIGKNNELDKADSAFIMLLDEIENTKKAIKQLMNEDKL